MKPTSIWFCWWQWKSVGPGSLAVNSTSNWVPASTKDGVFQDALSFRVAGQAAQFKGVAVEMDGMIVGAAIDE